MKNQEKTPKVTVLLKIDKKDIDISDSFSVEFFFDGQSHLGLVKGNNITLPKLPENVKFVSVVFTYDKYVLHFQKVRLDLIQYQGKIEWVFKIVYPPFNETQIKDIEVNKPSKIYYFAFSPDEGTGIEVIEPIYDE